MPSLIKHEVGPFDIAPVEKKSTSLQPDEDESLGFLTSLRWQGWGWGCSLFYCLVVVEWFLYSSFLSH